MPDLQKLQETAAIEAELMTWMAVHGGLCLALRHRDLTGAVRDTLLRMVGGIEEMLLAGGALTQAEIDLIHQVEAEESPHGD